MRLFIENLLLLTHTYLICFHLILSGLTTVQEVFKLLLFYLYVNSRGFNRTALGNGGRSIRTNKLELMEVSTQTYMGQQETLGEPNWPNMIAKRWHPISCC